MRLPCLEVTRHAQAAAAALAACDVMHRLCLQSRRVGGRFGRKERGAWAGPRKNR
jgi:hypothetical protein